MPFIGANDLFWVELEEDSPTRRVNCTNGCVEVSDNSTLAWRPFLRPFAEPCQNESHPFASLCNSSSWPSGSGVSGALMDCLLGFSLEILVQWHGVLQWVTTNRSMLRVGDVPLATNSTLRWSISMPLWMTVNRSALALGDAEDTGGGIAENASELYSSIRLGSLVTLESVMDVQLLVNYSCHGESSTPAHGLVASGSMALQSNQHSKPCVYWRAAPIPTPHLLSNGLGVTCRPSAVSAGLGRDCRSLWSEDTIDFLLIYAEPLAHAPCIRIPKIAAAACATSLANASANTSAPHCPSQTNFTVSLTLTMQQVNLWSDFLSGGGTSIDAAIYGAVGAGSLDTEHSFRIGCDSNITSTNSISFLMLCLERPAAVRALRITTAGFTLNATFGYADESTLITISLLMSRLLPSVPKVYVHASCPDETVQNVLVEAFLNETLAMSSQGRGLVDTPVVYLASFRVSDLHSSRCDALVPDGIIAWSYAFPQHRGQYADELVAVGVTTDGSAVVLDATPPTLLEVRMWSDRHEYVVEMGDIVLVELIASEALREQPVVRVAGRIAETVGPSTWAYSVFGDSAWSTNSFRYRLNFTSTEIFDPYFSGQRVSLVVSSPCDIAGNCGKEAVAPTVEPLGVYFHVQPQVLLAPTALTAHAGADFIVLHWVNPNVNSSNSSSRDQRDMTCVDWSVYSSFKVYRRRCAAFPSHAVLRAPGDVLKGESYFIRLFGFAGPLYYGRDRMLDSPFARPTLAQVPSTLPMQYASVDLQLFFQSSLAKMCSFSVQHLISDLAQDIGTAAGVDPQRIQVVVDPLEGQLCRTLRWHVEIRASLEWTDPSASTVAETIRAEVTAAQSFNLFHGDVARHLSGLGEVAVFCDIAFESKCQISKDSGPSFWLNHSVELMGLVSAAAVVLLCLISRFCCSSQRNAQNGEMAILSSTQDSSYTGGVGVGRIAVHSGRVSDQDDSAFDEDPRWAGDQSMAGGTSTKQVIEIDATRSITGPQPRTWIRSDGDASAVAADSSEESDQDFESDWLCDPAVGDQRFRYSADMAMREEMLRRGQAVSAEVGTLGTLEALPLDVHHLRWQVAHLKRKRTANAAALR